MLTSGGISFYGGVAQDRAARIAARLVVSSPPSPTSFADRPGGLRSPMERWYGAWHPYLVKHKYHLDLYVNTHRLLCGEVEEAG